MATGRIYYIDPFFTRVQWKYLFSLLPRRSAGGKLIWLKRAYRGTVVWTGPGLPIEEHRWLTAGEYIFGKLQGNDVENIH